MWRLPLTTRSWTLQCAKININRQFAKKREQPEACFWVCSLLEYLPRFSRWKKSATRSEKIGMVFSEMFLPPAYVVCGKVMFLVVSTERSLYSVTALALTPFPVQGPGPQTGPGRDASPVQGSVIDRITPPRRHVITWTSVYRESPPPRQHVQSYSLWSP